MAIFALKPYQGLHYRPFTALAHALSEAEVDELISLGEALTPQSATLARESGSIVDPSFRNARVAWLYPDPRASAVFGRLAELIEQVNGESYRFDLLGFAEPIQYTVYEAPSVGYDWHIDMLLAPTEVQRKLSITIQLTDPADYDGGELELRDGSSVVTAPKGRGTLVAFPGWGHHRVTAVTRGTRKSLVAWIGGPAFR
ncbi:MAG: 2OG-Fe(II) oxygenase [Thermoanaerobaculia bacterium]